MIKIIREQQNLQTQTPEFKRWFGDSKVVDDRGNPLVVYHGTDKEFDTFDKKTVGKNHWQSNSATGGGFFFTDKESKASPLGITKAVFLKMENPLMRNLEPFSGVIPDYYNATDLFDNNSDSFFSEARVNRNDGIIIKTPKGSLYVAFHPNQIKSATDNNGDFDSRSNNIYEGGINDKNNT